MELVGAECRPQHGRFGKHTTIRPPRRRSRRATARAEQLHRRTSSTALARTVGHLTGGDAVVGFAHLSTTGAAVVGDRVVMLGDSAGFAFGRAVFEVADEPGPKSRTLAKVGA